MKTIFAVCAFLTLLAVVAVAAPSSQITGDYLETRSADVYVGQCFANGEMNTAGQEAIVAWHIGEGKWDGVSLDGLTVVGAIKAQATLGDPYRKPYPAKSVLFVDGQASPQQRQALINFAQEMGGELLRRHRIRATRQRDVVVVDLRYGVDVADRGGERAQVGLAEVPVRRGHPRGAAWQRLARERPHRRDHRCQRQHDERDPQPAG